jgi:hypothetical protein
MATNITVCYIAGEGRSGSTVLSTTLAEYAGFCCVGELHCIWRAVLTDELCSCGEPFYSCKFWATVGEVAFGGWHRLDLPRVSEVNRQLTRQRHVARLAFPPVRRRYSNEIHTFASVLQALYNAIGVVSQQSVIIDSSKGVPYLLMLRQVEGLDIRLVHLVRDSRGVAYSWAKQYLVQPQFAHVPTMAKRPMPSRGVAISAGRWVIANLAFEIIGRMGRRRVRVKYEPLVTDPNPVLDRILSAVGTAAVASGEHFGERSESDEETGFEPARHHILGGNPVRFHSGRMGLRKDEEWRNQMPTGSRLIVTFMTLPLLVAYKYLPERRRPSLN